jgi:hypothetical protein
LASILLFRDDSRPWKILLKALTMLLHDTKEFDNNLGARSDQDLTLAGLLGVVDGIERIVQDGGLHLGL